MLLLMMTAESRNHHKTIDHLVVDLNPTYIQHGTIPSSYYIGSSLCHHPVAGTCNKLSKLILLLFCFSPVYL